MTLFTGLEAACADLSQSVCASYLVGAQGFVSALPIRRLNPRPALPVATSGQPDGFSSNSWGVTSDYQSYLRDLSDLPAQLKAGGTDTSRIESVLYPFFGTDIGLPLKLFPRVKQIIAADPMGLFPPSTLANLRIHAQDPLGGAWRDMSHIRAETATGPRILGGILDFAADAEILHVHLFQSPLSGGGSLDRVSGIIDFDLHDGIGPRRLTYIAAALPDARSARSNSLNDYEIVSAMFRSKPQAVIIKASFGYFANHPLRDVIIEKIRRQNGIIVEGLAYSPSAARRVSETGTYMTELFKSISAENSRPHAYTRGRSQVVTGIPFGYSNGALVTDFSPAPRTGAQGTLPVR